MERKENPKFSRKRAVAPKPETKEETKQAELKWSERVSKKTGKTYFSALHNGKYLNVGLNKSKAPNTCGVWMLYNEKFIQNSIVIDAKDKEEEQLHQDLMDAVKQNIHLVVE